MKTAPYGLHAIAKWLGIDIAGIDDLAIENLAIDSRKPVSPDTLFIALKGERHDGHDHIAELIQRGVRSFVVSEMPPVEPTRGVVFLQVTDTLIALQHIATMHRSTFSLPVIGITGSNGKTIVKEWLFQLLSDRENCVRGPGSWNSQVGVPLSVWHIKPSHTIGIFEAGISQRGEMARLAPIIAPTIGVLTTIGPAHAEGFRNDAEKAREKCLLFRGAEAVIFCSDQPAASEAVDGTGVPVRDWSRARKAFVRVREEEQVGTAMQLVIEHAGSKHPLTIPFTDKASVDNAITCVTVMLHMGLEAAHINARLALLTPVEMRLRTMEGVHGSTLIDDSYSNDLASLAIALEHQARSAHGRDRIVVIGDIMESGMAPEELYADVADQLTRSGVKQVITVGPAVGALQRLFPKGTRSYPDADTLLQQEEPIAFAGAIVLVKGARNLHLESLVHHWQHQVHGTELEIDLDAIRHNLNHFRSLLQPGTRTMAMVKAFGYGSGAVELARLFAHERVDYLGVAYADEGIALRQQGIGTPILVMNPEPVPLETLLRFNLEAEVYDITTLEAAIAYARILNAPPGIHLKLDTGMHRLGFMENELPELLVALRDAPIHVVSILSHLAASEDPAQDAFTNEQIERFTSMAERIGDVIGYRPLWHIANSSSISRFPHAHFDMVRLGIGLHGVGSTPIEQAALTPAATLRTVVAQVKDIPAGEAVGYGRHAFNNAPSRIAVLPIGYADGFSRRLGNGVGRVWINNQEARTAGNICMDMCMVDVTGTKCKPGDEVIIFGKEHPVQGYAADLGTIAYEALTGIAQRVKRVYVRG